MALVDRMCLLCYVTYRHVERIIILDCCAVVDLMADMYENAHKSKPDSEEILNSLFMAYVRLGMCKKQQQVFTCFMYSHFPR